MSGLTDAERRAVLSRVPLAAGRDDDAIVACVEHIVAAREAAIRAALTPVRTDAREAAAVEAALAPVRALVHSDRTDRYRDEACRNTVALPYASNRYVRLLDDLRAVLPPAPSTQNPTERGTNP